MSQKNITTSNHAKRGTSYAFEFSLILESQSAAIKLLKINPLAHGGGDGDGEADSLASLERAITINSVRAA